MVKESRKAILVVLACAALLAACAPTQNPQQVQSEIGTGVALTVQAQNDMGTAVAQTLTAEAPLPSATSSPTLVLLTLPTLTALPTVTPFVVVPSGGGGGGSTAAQYACTFSEVKPLINVFKPGDPIDIVWIITNTGTKDWPEKKDLDFQSGTRFSPYGGEELPPLESGERVTISFEGNAPDEPGYYHMNFKVEGGLCFPFIDIQVIKPPGQDP